MSSRPFLKASLFGALALAATIGPLQAQPRADRAEPRAGAEPAAATEPSATPDAEPRDEEGRGDVATYLALLACAVVLARQIRRRGHTHIVLS